VVTAAETQALPGPVRRMAGRMGAAYLRLHVLERAPATFAHEPDEATVPSDVHGEHIEMVGHEAAARPESRQAG
jgi:hypothetical protein